MPEHGFTALHLATTSADVDSLASLIQMGARCDQPARDGILPVHIAAHLGLHKAMLQLLIAGCPLKNAEGMSPLHYVCSIPRVATVRPALDVLVCVDWIGDVPIKPQLLTALAHVVSEHEFRSDEGFSVQSSSRVRASAGAIRRVLSKRQDKMRIPGTDERQDEPREQPSPYLTVSQV
jgi:hypothetical protein